MAPTIASPMPRSHLLSRSLPKDILQPAEEGRGTPLPQYEKTQSVPFTLTLQEEKDNPGSFQLVVNIDPQHQKAPEGSLPKPAASKKLIANLKEAPSLGVDVSRLYQTLKSSPPSTPQEERQGWSDLDAIPPEFLKKVVPDWKVTFSRSDSTASTQSKKLADIKARIKKSGKGFVVRLLRGSSSDHEVVEVPLGQSGQKDGSALHEAQELDSTHTVAAELDGADQAVGTANDRSNAVAVSDEIFEIGTSSETGIHKATPPTAAAASTSIASWLNHASAARLSLSEEGFSDADTLLPEIRSIAERVEEHTDFEPMSRDTSVMPTRSGSVLSIVKTPTRGLSVVGPVRRVQKTNHVRSKGKATRFDLNRSGAHLSTRRRSPSQSSFNIPTLTTFDGSTPKQSAFRDTPLLSPPDHAESSDDPSSKTPLAWQHTRNDSQSRSAKAQRRSSAEELTHSRKPKAQLRLRTDVPRPKSATASPVSRRKRSPRTRKHNSVSSSVSFERNADKDDEEGTVSPLWSEVKPEEPSDDVLVRLREACGRVAEKSADIPNLDTGSIPRIEEPQEEANEMSHIPLIEEPSVEGEVGDFSFHHEMEIRTTLSSGRSPMSTFWGLVVTSLANKAIEGIKAFSKAYGSEPPVPTGHVRVHWTCACGEPLYDDFIEQRAGAARDLEAYLNRPRAHTPTSPSSSRSTTYDSKRSIFDSASRASTLATPASTYGGSISGKRSGSFPKMYPTRVEDRSPSYIRIAEESWLLTCANEGRFTPKIVHLDVNQGRIDNDKDLALVLREHYERLNRKWLRWARLRGLSTIEFVQFEVHRNRFADIRASPSMPPTSSSVNDKSPSHHPYTFESVGLVPPVGSAYLLHLFKHPEDYDGEQITYLRSPKRRARLETGMGWGINLVEGFQVQKVWAIIMTLFGIGSGVFAFVWTWKKGDVQGAFGVAGWVVTLAGLVLGTLQAWLD